MLYRESSKPNDSGDPGTLPSPLQTPSLEPYETSAVNAFSHYIYIDIDIVYS